MRTLYVGLLHRTPCKMYPKGVEIQNINDNNYERIPIVVENKLSEIDVLLKFNEPTKDWGMVEGIGFYDRLDTENTKATLVAWSGCCSRAVLKGDGAPQLNVESSKFNHVHVINEIYCGEALQLGELVNLLTDDGSKLLMHRGDNGEYIVWYKTAEVNRLTRHYKKSEEYTLESLVSYEDILNKIYKVLN